MVSELVIPIARLSLIDAVQWFSEDTNSLNFSVRSGQPLNRKAPIALLRNTHETSIFPDAEQSRGVYEITDRVNHLPSLHMPANKRGSAKTSCVLQ